MDMKKIGIKLADGSFFTILKEGEPDKKKIELTTVKDNQTTVQVSLYASESGTMEDAILIDTLKINKLERQPNGQPDIYLTASLDKNDNIEATLKDDSTKEQASISANVREALLASDKNPGTGKGLLGAAEELKLKSELDDLNFDMPDFDEGPAPQAEEIQETKVVEKDNFPMPDFDNVPIDEPIDEKLDMPNFDEPTPSNDDFELPDFVENSDNSFEEPAASSSDDLDFNSLYDDEENVEEKKTRLPVFVCLICAIICVLAVLLMLFVIPSKFNLLASRSSNKTEIVKEEAAPLPPPAQKEEPLPPPAPAAKEDEVVVIEEAEIVVPDLPKPEEKKAPKVITYKIKWGDTLWDISAAYYKNPWRYKKIAKYNGIKNPNHIVAGTYIKIPEE